MARNVYFGGCTDRYFGTLKPQTDLSFLDEEQVKGLPIFRWQVCLDSLCVKVPRDIHTSVAVGVNLGGDHSISIANALTPLAVFALNANNNECVTCLTPGKKEWVEAKGISSNIELYVSDADNDNRPMELVAHAVILFRKVTKIEF